MNPVTGEHLMGNPCVCQTCTQARDDARATSFRAGLAESGPLLNRIRTLLHMWWDWEASRDRLTTPPSESKAWMALSDERAEILREIHKALLRRVPATDAQKAAFLAVPPPIEDAFEQDYPPDGTP